MSNKKILDELNAMDNELHSFMAKWNFKAARLRNMLGAEAMASLARQSFQNCIAEYGGEEKMKEMKRQANAALKIPIDDVSALETVKKAKMLYVKARTSLDKTKDLIKRDIRELQDTIAYLKNEQPDRPLNITVREFLEYCETNGVRIPSRIIMAARENEEFANRLLHQLKPMHIYSLPYCHVKASVVFFQEVMNYHKNKI